MAIRESGPRHAHTGPRGYPPPEAYGPIGFAPELNGGPAWPSSGPVPAHGQGGQGWGVFVPQQAGITPAWSQPVPAQRGPAHRGPAHPVHPAVRPGDAYRTTPTNPLATSGFVVALIGGVLGVLPIVGLLALVLCPTGLGLSVAGLVRSDRRAGTGRGLAIAGLALGAVGLVASLLWLVALAR